MSPLPTARARVHGVAGEAQRAGAVVRHAARRTGIVAVATAKVVLWLSVVVASLVAIGWLGSKRQPRYPEIRADLEAIRSFQAQRELEASARAAAVLDQYIRDQAQARPIALDPPPPPAHPRPAHHHHRR